MGKQIYIIHGYEASPNNHWFQWLKEELTVNKNEVEVLSMPNSSDPKKDEWLKTLANEVKTMNNNTYFVTHSLGSITLLSYLDQLNPLPNFGGFILVSGFSESIPSLPILDPFTDKKINYDKIISATNSRVVIAAKDDSIVPYQLSKNLAEQLDASLYSVENGGHFLDREGFLTFPLVYDILNKMIQSE